MTLHAQACWLAKPRHAEIRDLELAPVMEGEALVRTLFSAISRGTEALVYEGRVPASEYQRMRAPFQDGEFGGPVKYGYINVGLVEAGPEELVGKRVFSLFPHQTRFVIPASACSALPEGLDSGRAVLLAGMETALNAIWDAAPKVGDKVSVVGGGVIGSLCAYLAGRMPGVAVELVDINPERAAVASALGAGYASPDEARGGADLVIHASGTEEGLRTALALAGREATVVEVSWFGDRQVSLPLGEAFHSQRLRLVSSQVGSLPACQHARWNHQRRMQCAMELLQDSSLEVLITGESEFADLPKTLERITKEPGALCHRISYPTHSQASEGSTHRGD